MNSVWKILLGLAIFRDFWTIQTKLSGNCPLAEGSMCDNMIVSDIHILILSGIAKLI